MSRTRQLFVLVALVGLAAIFGLPTDAESSSFVTINGPSNVYAETSCQFPVWTAVHATPQCKERGGVMYNWFVDGNYVGSGSSYSATFCPQSPATTFTIQIHVAVYCGSTLLGVDDHSAFISLCDNSGFGYPSCLG